MVQVAKVGKVTPGGAPESPKITPNRQISQKSPHWRRYYVRIVSCWFLLVRFYSRRTVCAGFACNDHEAM